jgi:hypothetical protein
MHCNLPCGGPSQGVACTGLTLLEELSKAAFNRNLAARGHSWLARNREIGRTNRPFLGCFRSAAPSASGTPSREGKRKGKILNELLLRVC